MIQRKSHEVFISLGSNLGDRLSNLRAAKQWLTEEVDLLMSSSIYETPPWGVIDQPEFFNLVVRGETRLTPLKLLAFLKKIELGMGRVKAVRFGPRLIDLDILLYDDLKMENPRLTIPHPRMLQRAFVLVPMAEIAADQLIPASGLTVRQHLVKLDISGIKKVISVQE